jgi:hypothetical protein
LTDTVNRKIAEQQKNINKKEQIQSQIHKEINYLYNSINLLVGRHACGKSFNVIREFIKIDMLPHHSRFTPLIIINDKPNDFTINELLPLIHVGAIQIDYDHTEGVLNEIVEGKTAYDQVVRKDLEGELTEESKQDILSKTCDDDFYNELPHTFILLDDTINILTQKKYKKLQQMLFRNRQPRFTICICVQMLLEFHLKLDAILTRSDYLVEMYLDRTSCTY